MEDPRWLRLITIGLILSALAVGYFLLTGKFTATKTNKPTASTQPTQQVQNIQASPSPSASGLTNRPSSTPSATSTAGANGSNIASLPRTGFPVALIGIFSASAIIAGFGLRKYPN